MPRHIGSLGTAINRDSPTSTTDTLISRPGLVSRVLDIEKAVPGWMRVLMSQNESGVEKDSPGAASRRDPNQSHDHLIHSSRGSEEVNDKDQQRIPEQKAVVESPHRERERSEDAESLFNVSQPPDQAGIEDGIRHRHRPDRIADAIESPKQERERFEDAESLFSIPQPPDEVEVEEGTALTPEQKESPKVYPPLAYPVITSLIPGSIFGVLARLGLLALTNYDQRSVFSLAWVQAAGCLVMGFSLGLREQIGAYYGPLYTAIATGFCGSLTTFSSWQLDVFMSWANPEHAQRGWFRDVIDGLAKTAFTLAISLSSVTLGLHLSRPVGRLLPRVKVAPLYVRYVFRIVSVLMYAATIVVYFETSPSFRHKATAAMLFSFPGALTRYILATALTPLLHLFPLGTFVANTAGTALLGIFHVLQRTPRLPSPNGCAILQGLMDGFCGCLTTVSTFAVEVQALRTRKAWLYVGLSWGVSQLLLLVILGSAWWGANIDDNRACTFD